MTENGQPHGMRAPVHRDPSVYHTGHVCWREQPLDRTICFSVAYQEYTRSCMHLTIRWRTGDFATAIRNAVSVNILLTLGNFAGSSHFLDSPPKHDDDQDPSPRRSTRQAEELNDVHRAMMTTIYRGESRPPVAAVCDQSLCLLWGEKPLRQHTKTYRLLRGRRKILLQHALA
jgi:hypothetical protein